jgi:hypothetical protein
MRLIIAGGRNVAETDVYRALLVCPWTNADITEVVSGCAKGADTFGEEWARRMSIPVMHFPANWELYGRAAGPIRNREMATHADALLAVWDGQSPGTKDMIRVAELLGLKVFVYRTDQG